MSTLQRGEILFLVTVKTSRNTLFWLAMLPARSAWRAWPVVGGVLKTLAFRQPFIQEGLRKTRKANHVLTPANVWEAALLLEDLAPSYLPRNVVELFLRVCEPDSKSLTCVCTL